MNRKQTRILLVIVAILCAALQLLNHVYNSAQRQKMQALLKAARGYQAEVVRLTEIGAGEDALQPVENALAATLRLIREVTPQPRLIPEWLRVGSSMALFVIVVVLWKIGFRERVAES